MQSFSSWTARISPIRDEISDGLQVLAVIGPKSRTLMDVKIAIIFRANLVVDVWSSWRSLVPVRSQIDRPGI